MPRIHEMNCRSKHSKKATSVPIHLFQTRFYGADISNTHANTKQMHVSMKVYESIALLWYATMVTQKVLDWANKTTK